MVDRLIDWLGQYSMWVNWLFDWLIWSVFPVRGLIGWLIDWLTDVSQLSPSFFRPSRAVILHGPSAFASVLHSVQPRRSGRYSGTSFHPSASSRQRGRGPLRDGGRDTRAAYESPPVRWIVWRFTGIWMAILFPHCGEQRGRGNMGGFASRRVVWPAFPLDDFCHVRRSTKSHEPCSEIVSRFSHRSFWNTRVWQTQFAFLFYFHKRVEKIRLKPLHWNHRCKCRLGFGGPGEWGGGGGQF